MRYPTVMMNDAVFLMVYTISSSEPVRVGQFICDTHPMRYCLLKAGPTEDAIAYQRSRNVIHSILSFEQYLISSISFPTYLVPIQRVTRQ